MKKVITYGTFDLLHFGHVNLLRRAKALGDYLIVGVTSQDFDVTRGKINVKQSLTERMQAVMDTGYVDEVIPEEYVGQKIDDIRKYDVDIFAIGSDWRGKFDYLNDYCQVVYLDRTEGVSSTELREKGPHVRLGVIGSSTEAQKFIGECRYVSGLDVVGVLPADADADLEHAFDVPVFASFEDASQSCDALYVVDEPRERAATVKRLLLAGKHVICESPIAFSRNEAKELFALAEEKGLVLHEAIKTAYATAFNRLIVLAQSGLIGRIKAVNATCTSLQRKDKESSLIGWGPFACLPIFRLLGTEYDSCHAVSYFKDGASIDSFTKIDFLYPTATATMQVGTGVKSEGELIVSGSRGYIYVPAPWWKTDYFEVRYEDQTLNKRYFYQLDGEGIRLEIAAFVQAIQGEAKANYNIDSAHTVAFSGLIEDYYSGALEVASIS